MDWGQWIQGLISSAASAIVVVITALIVLPSCPAGWQLFVIAVGPFLINFFSYIKQTPPPIGQKKVFVDKTPQDLLDEGSK